MFGNGSNRDRRRNCEGCLDMRPTGIALAVVMYLREQVWGAEDTFANRNKCRQSAMAPEEGHAVGSDSLQGMKRYGESNCYVGDGNRANRTCPLLDL